MPGLKRCQAPGPGMPMADPPRTRGAVAAWPGGLGAVDAREGAHPFPVTEWVGRRDEVVRGRPARRVGAESRVPTEGGWGSTAHRVSLLPESAGHRDETPGGDLHAFPGLRHGLVAGAPLAFRVQADPDARRPLPDLSCRLLGARVIPARLRLGHPALDPAHIAVAHAPDSSPVL